MSNCYSSCEDSNKAGSYSHRVRVVARVVVKLHKKLIPRMCVTVYLINRC